MQEYKIVLKDEDGQIYDYNYHSFEWSEGGPLMIYRAGGLTSDGTRKMVMMAKFQNCRAILEIGEIDENED